MANVVVDTTGYWGVVTPLSGTWAGLLFGESVTVTNGAVLTIDPAQSTTALAVGVSVVATSGFSKLRIVNASTSSSVVLYGALSTTLRIESGCAVETVGDYITIGTGNGSANQTFTGWTATAGYNAADEPAMVEVETGSGTGVYNKYVNIGDLTLATDTGVGEIGNFFSYNNSTGVITVGDSGLPEDITVDASAGASAITVADASAYSATDYIHIKDDTNGNQYTTTISSIVTNTLNLDDVLPFEILAADDCFVRHVKGGNIVPNGAKVRAYNIGIGTMTTGSVRTISSTLANNFETDTSLGGIIDFEKTYGFGFYFHPVSAQSVSIQGFAVINSVLTNQLQFPAIEDLTIAYDRYDSNVARKGWESNNDDSSEITNLIACSEADNSFYGFFSSNLNIVNPTFYQHKRTGTSTVDYSLYVRNSNNVIFTGLVIVGGSAHISTCFGMVVNGVSHSDSPHGEPYTSAVPVYGLYCSGSPVIMGDVLSIDDGFPNAGTGIFIYQAQEVYDADYDTRCRTFYSPNTDFNNRVVRCKVGSPTSDIIYPTGLGNTEIQNVSATDTPTATAMGLTSGTIIKGLSFPSKSTDNTPGSGLNSIFYEMQYSAGAITEGFMGVFFNPKSEDSTYYTATSGIRWNYNGRLYLTADNDSILYTWPHWVKGVTEFPSGGSVTINGSGTGNFVLEYQIDVGAGWTSLATLNHANLSGNTIDPDTGFRFRLKVSRVTGSSTEYLDRLNWDTTVDYDSYQYPINLVDITAQNIKDGSEYWLKNRATGQVLGSGTQSGTGVITISGVPYEGDPDNIYLRVRKKTSDPKYQDFYQENTLSATGANFFVSQVLDTVA